MKMSRCPLRLSIHRTFTILAINNGWWLAVAIVVKETKKIE